MAFLFIIAISVIGSIVYGWALSLLWSWFIVPTFGLTPLSIPVAIGLALIVSFMTYQYDSASENNKKKKMEEIVVSAIVYCLARPVIIVLFGFVVKIFM